MRRIQSRLQRESIESNGRRFAAAAKKNAKRGKSRSARLLAAAPKCTAIVRYAHIELCEREVITVRTAVRPGGMRKKAPGLDAGGLSLQELLGCAQDRTRS